MSGFFLVVEGPEGAGKSTLVAGLERTMRERGLDPVVVREPGGTPAAERIRSAFLDPASRFAPATELLFLAAARAHLVQEVIRPALGAGRIVLGDRYQLSTEAYQGAGRGLDAATISLVGIVATGGLRPQLTLVLDIPPALGRQRQRNAGKSRDRLEREDPGFHDRVARAYLAASGEGVRHLDGTLAPAALLEAAWAEVLAAAPETFRGTRG
ncbi:MAG TPA: dTMP kinase [Gemmatimonadales bacterium]|nr:dTMP kinase [Gemmatimonadales bacterium]